MKNRKRICKVSAMLLILALLLSTVSTGVNENGSGAVYSDWLHLDELLGSEEVAEPSGTRDLRTLLRDAALLDADGTVLSEDGVWPVTADAAQRVRLGFRETPGDESRQFDAENPPLVFPLPKEMSAGDENLTLPLRIAADSGESAEAVCLYDAAENTLSVSWDPESGAAELIRASESASFEAVIPAVFSDADTLVFADHLTVSLVRMRSAPLMAPRAGQTTSSDLADFLDRIVIVGAELNAEGKYVILEGVPYTIQMYFSEKINGIQFDEDSQGGSLVYHFPNGFTPNHAEGTVEMTGDGGVVRFDYVIDGETLTVTFDKTSPGYSAFIRSENAEIEIHATGLITEEEIEFSSEVSGEFDIDDKREVSVQKVGEYDGELNRIKFTVRAYSKGNNTNIHIGDVITGTALTYDPGSLTVSSSTGSPVPYSADTRPGETFGLTIPSMVHGETVTVEYYADVDLGSLTPTGSGHYGTVEETGNSVRITSDENPPGDHDETSDEEFTHRITLSTIGKTATDRVVHDGKTYITWTIVLNEDANISIAGKSVTDTIDASSQAIMRYSGSGIHIERYLKDGTPAGTSDVHWGTDGLSASKGGSAWTYTIPETDAGSNYKYVITYETEVDSETFLIPTSVSNTVEDEYGSDHGSTGVETTGEEVEASKTALQSVVDTDRKEAETEWEITFTVPAAGLDSAEIIDSLPGLYDYIGGRWFYDAYKSVRIGDGDLLDGESYTVETRPQDHQVIISFTKNGGEPGLTGTGLTRTIRVYLTTTAGHDWLEYAESQSWARTHVNNAVVRVNGQDIHVTAQVSFNTTAYDLEKIQDGIYTTSTDPALPIYLYKIILTNVNDAAFNAEGFLTVTDTYNSDYLMYLPEYQTYDAGNVNTPNGRVYGNNQWNKYSLQVQGPYVVAQAEPAGQLVFRLNKADLPKFQSSYYPYYAIVYALQIKDAETLARMQEEALHADGLKVDLANIATNDQFGTSEIVTEYSVKALEKKLEWEEDSDNGTHDLHFSISVNPLGLKIGDGDTITLKDTLTNLSFDYTSIDIDPVLDGDILNRSGNSIIFTLHNEMPYRITYTARLIGIHDVHWNNKADLHGYVSDVNGTSSSESGGSGSYSSYGMNVLKYAEGNMNDGLGATFELYEARVKDAGGNNIPEPDWVKVHEFTTDGTTGLYTIESVAAEGRSLRPYSYHDGDGNERFGAAGTESYGWRYRIREIIAPDGYQKTNVEYEFGISDIPSYTAPYTYLNRDTVTIVNKPIPLPVDTSVPGRKVMVGKELESHEFTFSLTPEETALAAWGDGYPGGFTGSLTAFNDESGRFSFPLSFTYDDYLNAAEKGFVDGEGRACLYYVVREVIPEGAEDNVWKNIRFDDSRFLVLVRLSVEGDRLATDTVFYPYGE